MAKKKTMKNVPQATPIPPSVTTPSPTPAPSAKSDPVASEFKPVEVSTITITLPTSQPETSGTAGMYFNRKSSVRRGIQVERLDDMQWRGLRSYFEGVINANVKLANGKRVISRSDAMRWLGEQIAATLSAPK